MREKTHPAVYRLPVRKDRIDLGELIRRVHAGKQYLLLEKDGVAVAAVMDAEEFEDYLEVRDPAVRAQIKKSTAAYKKGRTRPIREFLDELDNDRPARKRHRAL